MTVALTVILLALVCAVTATGRILRRRSQSIDNVWLPPELRYARLLYAEKQFEASNPALVAKLDRGYLSNGMIVLLELKTRRSHTVFASDIIELSAQRVAVIKATGQRVAAHGWVLTQTSDSKARMPHHVRLLPTHEVVDLITRRKRLLEGSLEPRYASNRGLCRRCPYAKECNSDRQLVRAARR